MKNDNKFHKTYKKQYYKTSRSRRNQKPIHGELLYFLTYTFIQFLKNTCEQLLRFVSNLVWP